MNLFIAICALFLAGAIVLLVLPLLRPRAEGEPVRPAPVAAIVVVALMPLAALLIYVQASNWDWHANPEASVSTPDLEHHANPEASVSTPDIKRMVEQLQGKLAKQPDDIEGWKLLGRSATVLGDFPLARSAFGEAYTRTQGHDAEAVVGYAESLVLIDEREIDGPAAELFERALKMAPENPRALWYGGIVAYRRGDMALAQRRWVELQNFDLPADLRQVLAERLAELEKTQGKPISGAVAAPPTGAVEITIALRPDLAGRVRPGSTLFVIARRGGSGPPLAVQRHPARDWPVSVHLSDADAMLPGTSLAKGGALTLIARISRSGQPIAASGDLFGEVSYDFASAHPANITIDRIVP